MLFRGKITQKREVVLGNQAVFCPAWAGFRWGIAQKCYAFSMRNYTKLRSAVGEGGDFLPRVGRFSLGNSMKSLCFFDVELYKIMECWRGMGRFFAWGGRVFAGG